MYVFELEALRITVKGMILNLEKKISSIKTIFEMFKKITIEKN